MSTPPFRRFLGACVAGLGLLPVPDATAAFRAYLASTGSDANPCTLTQPCRLLPAALAAVDEGGDIWMLDSANYNTGTVWVQKSVTILAVPGALGSVVANAGTGMIVYGTGIRVTLRNVAFRNMADAQHTGLLVANAAHTTLDGVTMTGLGGGLDVQSGDFTVTGSRFTEVGTAIVVEGASSGTVVRTRVTGPCPGASGTQPCFSGIQARPMPDTNAVRLSIADSEVSGCQVAYFLSTGTDVRMSVEIGRAHV